MAGTASHRLPIAELAVGEIAPPMEPRHASWNVLAGWDDPFAPRGGYRVASHKARIAFDGQPAVLFHEREIHGILQQDRALVCGAADWRDYRVSCRVRQLAAQSQASEDAGWRTEARAGLVFRTETSRRHYYFCVEAMRRLVLYRRVDDEWTELFAGEVDAEGKTLTLAVDLVGDDMRVACPELKVSAVVTDSEIREGRVGFRARGACWLFALSVERICEQERVVRRRRESATGTKRNKPLPEPREIGVIVLDDGEGLLLANGQQGRMPEAFDFHTVGRNDLLFRTADGVEARTLDGTRLWRADLLAASGATLSAGRGATGGRTIYLLAGRADGERESVAGKKSPRIRPAEIVALSGHDGHVLARTLLPEPVGDEFDVSAMTGAWAGGEGIVLKADSACGARDLWAYGPGLDLLWHTAVAPSYGHHSSVHLMDINGDGSTEVLAGGTLLSAKGERLWTFEGAQAALDYPTGPEHCDAAFALTASQAALPFPVAFLVHGGLGVYVVDARNGRVLAHHRVGHAQWGCICKLRADVPGLQVLAGTRWGNFGILTLFSARGERLWSIQPDYILQGAVPVQWTREGPQHLWQCTSRQAMGLYDGLGERADDLEPIRQIWGDRTRMDMGPLLAVRRSPDGTDLLAVGLANRLHLYAAEE